MRVLHTSAALAKAKGTGSPRAGAAGVRSLPQVPGTGRGSSVRTVLTLDYRAVSQPPPVVPTFQNS